MTFVHLHQEFPELAQRGTLVIVHRDELIRQTAATYKRVYPHLAVHVERGSDVADPAADVIIASVQSLGRKGSGERRTERLQQFGLIIVDEVRVRTNSTVCILCRKLPSVLVLHTA
jgi:superfamily II DNA or RNA helicase